jgi:hypothetical protein
VDHPEDHPEYPTRLEFWDILEQNSKLFSHLFPLGTMQIPSGNKCWEGKWIFYRFDQLLGWP